MHPDRDRAARAWTPLLGVVLMACGGQSLSQPSDDEPAGADASENGTAREPPNAGSGTGTTQGSEGGTRAPGAAGGSTIGSGGAHESPIGGRGGADSSVGGADAVSPDAGVAPPAADPERDEAALSLAGPYAEYAFASFLATNDGGWVLAEAVETDAAELVVGSRTLAAGALADEGGALADLGVASCGARSTDPVVRRVPGDYPTIQSGIDATNPGDTVLVAPGVYSEQLRLRSHVKLIGSGAGVTVLDGGNLAANLIDFTGARSAVVSGFTLRNVVADGGCSADDPWICSGDWYRAAVYGDGSSDDGDSSCGGASSLLFTRNAVIGNEIGVLLYFHARAVITNNVFVSNRHALVANHHQDHSLVANNVFYRNDGHAIVAQASHLSVLNNVFAANGTAFAQEYIQRGWVGCNVAFGNDELGDGFSNGGFVAVDALFVAPGENFELDAQSPARGLGCMGENLELPTDAGAFGGPLGKWSL